MPLGWASTQENLGLAYKALAEKSKNQVTLLQGIHATRSALEVFEKGQVAFNVERAKRNLASTEALLEQIKS